MATVRKVLFVLALALTVIVVVLLEWNRWFYSLYCDKMQAILEKKLKFL